MRPCKKAFFCSELRPALPDPSKNFILLYDENSPESQTINLVNDITHQLNPSMLRTTPALSVLLTHSLGPFTACNPPQCHCLLSVSPHQSMQWDFNLVGIPKYQASTVHDARLEKSAGTKSDLCNMKAASSNQS